MPGIEAGLDPLGQIDFILGGQQGGFADSVEIDADEISGRTLGVQIAVNRGSDVCHGGLLIGTDCQAFQRLTTVQSSRLPPISHPFDVHKCRHDLRMC